MNYSDDTIAAISTPVGQGGIGIVRISGSQSIVIAQKIFLNKNKKKLSQAKAFSILYGHIIDPVSESIIDEVLISVMRLPNSYTKEDVVEINCHGGMIAVRKILELTLQQGARLAEPG
jgi:tRNA modification GTPase